MYFLSVNVVFVAGVWPASSDVVVLWSLVRLGPLSSLLSHTLIIVTTRSQLIDKLVIRPSFVMHSCALRQSVSSVTCENLTFNPAENQIDGTKFSDFYFNHVDVDI